MIAKILDGLFSEGGLLRVRSLLAFGFTGIGGGFVLLHQTMPPGEFNALWAVAVTYYFASRQAAGANGGAGGANGAANG